MTTICQYGHVLPERHPLHTKYITPPPTAIQLAYKRKPESLSEQFVNLMTSRPRAKVIVCKAKSNKHYYDYGGDKYPMYLNHVPGKRGLSQNQVARFERCFYSPEPVATINNSVHRRYLYEHERRLPSLVHSEPMACNTISVNPGPEYAPLPRSKYDRPRVHWSDDTYAPYVMEVRQRK